MAQLLTSPAEAGESAIVTKAAIRAADHLNLSNRTLGAIIGLSESTISRMKKGAYLLGRGDKAFELSVLFIRMYRSLTSIVGGDDAVARAWLSGYNTALHAKPIDKLQTVNGLVDVINYLDARRAVI